MDSLRPLQRATYTDILDYGFYLFRKHFKKLLIINLIFNIPVMLLVTIFNPLFTDRYWSLLDQTDIVITDPSEILSSVFALYAMLFGSLLLQGLYTLTLKNVMEGSVVKILYADTVLRQDRSIKQVVKECFNQFGTLFLGRMIYILIQIAVFIVLYLVIIAGMFILSFGTIWIAAASNVAPWAYVLMIILVLILILGVFVYIIIISSFYGKYWMFIPAICIEQQKAGSSIGRCGDLGKRNFLLIGLSYLLGNILFWLLPFTVSFAFTITGLSSGSFNAEMIRLSTVITQIFSEILRPLLTCILTALYITLRVKCEGLDMEITLWELKREELERKNRWLQEASNVTQ